MLPQTDYSDSQLILESNNHAIRPPFEDSTEDLGERASGRVLSVYRLGNVENFPDQT